MVTRGFKSSGPRGDPSRVPPGQYAAFCDGGYTTNHSLEDLVQGRGLIAYEYDGAPEHGGPVRLLVLHTLRMRGRRPFASTNLKSGEGLDQVASFVVEKGGLTR